MNMRNATFDKNIGSILYFGGNVGYLSSSFSHENIAKNCAKYGFVIQPVDTNYKYVG